MTGFKNILVPTDFSECAERALDDALMLASKFGSKVTLLHAFLLLVPAYGAGLYFPVADLEREAQKALDAALARARQKYPDVDGVLAIGDVAQEILRATAERHIDLVVMGTHGRRGLSRLVLGSVAEHVVRTSRVPVLTVCAQEGAKAKASPGKPAVPPII